MRLPTPPPPVVLVIADPFQAGWGAKGGGTVVTRTLSAAVVAVSLAEAAIVVHPLWWGAKGQRDGRGKDGGDPIGHPLFREGRSAGFYGCGIAIEDNPQIVIFESHGGGAAGPCLQNLPDAIWQCCQSWCWLWSTVSKWSREGLFTLSVGWLCDIMGPEGRAYSVY
jgi:hypothetical protein